MLNSATVGLKEIAGSKLDIGLAAEGGNDGNAVGTGRADLGSVLFGDAADRDAGMTGFRENFLKPGNADGRSCGPTP